MLTAQFCRYVIAGCVAVTVHLCVLVLLVEHFAVIATVATGAGFVLGCVANYLLQRAWVFRDRTSPVFSIARYALVTAGTFACNLGLFWLAHHALGLWYPVSQLLATGIIFLGNFVINRHFTFRPAPREL